MLASFVVPAGPLTHLDVRRRFAGGSGVGQIEDSWIDFFCVTANLTHSRMDVHRSGVTWRYVRASMSLIGFIPPLCDRGQMLVDGGYLNNLPADVMRAHSSTKHIIAVDVGRSDEIENMDYGDSVSGWYVLWRSLLPFGKRLRVPTLAEIQSRLAYVSSVKQRDMVSEIPGCLYLRPPVSGFEILDFHRAPEIIEVGYRYGLQCVEEWRAQGLLPELVSRVRHPSVDQAAQPKSDTHRGDLGQARMAARTERLRRRLSF